MKNIIKTVWSCWNKIDRFVAIFSLIIIIAALCFMCTSCNAQPNSNDIPTMEYYEVNSDEDILDNYIPIYADGVVDFIYCTQDYEFIIEYQDDDYFDMDNPQQMSNTVNCASSDENLVCLYCSEEIFFEYLEWYNALTNDEVIARDNPEFYAPSDKFYIKEQWVGDVDNGYWYYKLVKK